MKQFVISELLLLSELERSAKRIQFHRDLTLILGQNDTGKSSVLKSIYQTFGATPAKLHPDWLRAEVLSVVKFTLDEVPYTILRKGDVYAIFDREQRMISRFNKVTSELGPFLAELLSFKLKLTSQSDEAITPPPAFCFLPYYIDQDEGWTRNWASFARLGQMKNWRTSVVEYHTGIKPNEYYVAKAALQAAETELKKENYEHAILSGVRDRMQSQTRVAQFDVSLDDFKSQLGELLKRCQLLMVIEERLKASLRDLNAELIQVEARRGLVKEALREVGGDYAFATERLLHDTVECPTCGAIYDNSFLEQFEIAKDEERLGEMLFQLDEEQRGIAARIEREQTAYSDNRVEVQSLNELLQTRQEEVSLAMVLQSEGRKEVDAAFVANLKESRERQNRLDDEATSQRVELKRWDDRDKKKEIVQLYQSTMRSYLHELNVKRLPEASFKRIDSTIVESGSDQPRALLAYFTSILQVMARHSTATFCPIVIDSPNQQAQDPTNLAVMLKFIRDRMPKSAQVVLGLEDVYDIDFPGAVVQLTQKNRLLTDDDYESVMGEIAPLKAKVLAVS